MTKKIGGMLTIMETPFTSDGKKLDEQSLRRHVSHMVENGVQGLIPMGTNGEFYAMTDEERKTEIKVIVDEANGKVPVIAGTSHSGTLVAAELSKYAEDVGADAVIVLPPYYAWWYYPLTEHDFHYHYGEIAKAVDIPVVLYDIPPFGIPENAIIKLASEFDNVRYMKETYDLQKMRRLHQKLGSKMEVFCGDDQLLLEYYSKGAKGATITLPCIAPKQTLAFFKEMEKGDLARARQVLERLDPLVDALYAMPPGPSIIAKECLVMMGIFSSAHQRHPQRPIDEETRVKLRKILQNLGIVK
jgi:4-hydroxy-tetrahydrodipicolinate synthase